MSDSDLNVIKDLDTATIVAMMYIEFRDMKEDLRKDYVRKDDFTPVKRLCYALVASLFTAGLAGIVTMIVK